MGLTRSKLALLGLALMFSVWPLVAEAAQPTLVTVDQIKTNWQRYDGRLVTVRGQLDNCFNGIYGIGCMLCPEQMTTWEPNDCLSLEFASEVAPPRVDQQRSMRVVSVQQETYRFATVTVEALLDATWLTDRSGNSVKPDPPLFHDGAPPNLRDARVLQVHTRKSARDGLGPSGAPLTLASPQEREAMLAAFAVVYPPDRIYTREAFAIELSQADLQDRQSGDPYIPDGAICMCVTDDCQNLWPTRWFLGMKSPANPFRCWTLQKIDGQWRLLLSWD